MRNRKIMSLLLTLSLIVLSLPVFAQTQQIDKKAQTEAEITAAKAQGVTTFSGSGNGTYTIASADGATFINSFGVSDMFVKGQPFSAQAINESIQVLSDGNRIVRKSITILFRDNEGRSRREQTLTSIGPIAVEGNSAKIIYINDPVAGVTYTLDERNKTARKFVIPTSADGKKAYAEGYAAGSSYAYTIGQGGTLTATSMDREKAVLEAKAKEKAKEKTTDGQVTVSGNNIVVAGGVAQTSSYSGTISKREQKKESLGTQTMEGVEVQGERYTSTIPAGEIGNELPINVITEKWYSQELKQVIFTKTTDPRYGETIYRLTNIVRDNPDRSLFDVPSDYTIKEFKPTVMTTTAEPKVQEELKKKAKPQQ